MNINQYPELYDAIFKNSVWPQDLMKNLSDPDYLELKFDGYLNDGIRAEIIFMDEGKKIIALYYFDKREFIQRIEMIEDYSCSVIYDRVAEVTSLLQKFGIMDKLEEVIKLIAA